MDWVADLAATEGPAQLAKAFDAVLDGEGHEDADHCQTASAAAEVLAAFSGDATPQLPTAISAWVSRQFARSDADMKERAIAAVSRVSADSELRELWDESNESAAWSASLSDLKSRLGG
jgi:hypothetical protein